MAIDKESLEVLNVALNDWDDNNRFSEDYDKAREKLVEIYEVLGKLVDGTTQKYFPDFKLNYSTDMVCEDCGSNEWHVNLSYNNRNGGIYYGEIDVMGEETGEDVWCHKCESWRDLIEPNEFEGQEEN